MAGGAIGWYSKLQTIVALSTTKAEYMAAVEAGKEIAWMRNIPSEFGYGVEQPSTLKMDNQSAITVSQNPEHHGHMKHLDLRLYWLRDKVEHGMLNPDFIPTGDMIADCLTKSVPAPKVHFCRGCLGLISLFPFHFFLLIYFKRHVRLWGGVRVIVTCHRTYI